MSKKIEIMKEVSLKQLLEAGCHFGHQTTRWNPKMRPYIFAAKEGIHIFDLVKTKEGLEAACAFAKATASQGGKIIFIGTKRQSQSIVKAAAERVNMPYVTERWIGGLITNWEMLKKRLSKLAELKLGKTNGQFKNLTKKENLMIDKEIVKMERVFGGVANLAEVPAAIFVADGKKDEAALREARNRGVASIAIIDTNVNPDWTDYLIPANDDAIKSIELIVNMIADAIGEGKTVGGKKPSFAEASEGKEVGSEKAEVKVEDKKKEEKVKEEKPKEKKVAKKAKKEIKK